MLALSAMDRAASFIPPTPGADTPSSEARSVLVFDPAKVSSVPPAHTAPHSKLKVLFMHGKAGSPEDHTASYLLSRFDALVPRMPTSDLDLSCRYQENALKEFQPDVVVAESLGAWVCWKLMERGLWTGGTVWLAPAVDKIERDIYKQRELGEAKKAVIPEGVKGPVVVVHGSRDDVVPLEDSRHIVAISARPGRDIKLVEVDDDHSMRMVVDSDQLTEWIEWVSKVSAGRDGGGHGRTWEEERQRRSAQEE
ncbi:hypothetical protein DFJ74DRAFT_685744 [Hyaloraphidium curvatum]|nr:hypothetical protein DFJ74DRAFT_685744 [Hyaloraphidium curvatum]